MKKIILLAMLIPWWALSAQQSTDGSGPEKKGETVIGGYGQIDLDVPLEDEGLSDLDVHRVVLMIGHRFNDRVSLVSEIEVEHVKEIYLEQAYVNYKINDWASFRGGLLLVPMGIINLYHESATFFSVDRPMLDHSIAPSTWREIGAGFSGKFLEQGIRYEVYVINGFKSYDDGGLLGGANGLRSGRQKGAESIMKFPNLALRTEYFGLDGLELGLSVYTGKTQSTLYGGIDDDPAMTSMADSSVIGMFMIGADARYSVKGWKFRAQVYNNSLTNTDEYNMFTGRDLGSRMFGYYAEAAYDLMRLCKDPEGELFTFVRYTAFDTHASTGTIDRNPMYERSGLTAGFSWQPVPGAAFKLGYQMLQQGDDEDNSKVQAGVAFTF